MKKSSLNYFTIGIQPIPPIGAFVLPTTSTSEEPDPHLSRFPSASNKSNKYQPIGTTIVSYKLANRNSINHSYP
jgi:hypothetical protein